MDYDQKERVGVALIIIIGFIAMIMISLGLWNENAKLKQEIQNGSSHADNVPAPSIRASCPTVPATTVTVYRDRSCPAQSQVAIARILPAGDGTSVDRERLRELAKQADDIVSAVRNQ